ncbi:MAG: hypothetical protein HGJ94_18245 [Desulfosarcina sp.]|nr:hypothetical protein [Desulfosarcina sp.]
MSTFEGLFELRNQNDLLKKLQYDYKRLEESPINQYTAFDFFVTAEHMLDWLYPDERNRREQVKDRNVLLRICSHIASGAKHFQATASHHDSVQDAIVQQGAFSIDFSDSFKVGHLQIQLQGQAACELGNSIKVIDLARKVLDFWKNYEDHQG